MFRVFWGSGFRSCAPGLGFGVSRFRGPNAFFKLKGCFMMLKSVRLGFGIQSKNRICIQLRFFLSEGRGAGSQK